MFWKYDIELKYTYMFKDVIDYVIQPTTYLQLSLYTVYTERERERERFVTFSSRFCRVIEDYSKELENYNFHRE